MGLSCIARLDALQCRFREPRTTSVVLVLSALLGCSSNRGGGNRYGGNSSHFPTFHRAALAMNLAGPTGGAPYACFKRSAISGGGRTCDDGRGDRRRNAGRLTGPDTHLARAYSDASQGMLRAQRLGVTADRARNNWPLSTGGQPIELGLPSCEARAPARLPEGLPRADQTWKCQIELRHRFLREGEVP